MHGCPCGSGIPLDGCCGRFLDGSSLPDTAEELMRSRYTAYATGDVDYLLATQHEQDREGVEAWAREARFTGLEILETLEGGPADERGVVEFTARWESRGETHLHRERSSFERHLGRWLYVGGETPKPVPVRREAPRTGRNDPCPCGSGRKFKKCCGG